MYVQYDYAQVIKFHHFYTYDRKIICFHINQHAFNEKEDISLKNTMHLSKQSIHYDRIYGRIARKMIKCNTFSNIKIGKLYIFEFEFLIKL